MSAAESSSVVSISLNLNLQKPPTDETDSINETDNEVHDDKINLQMRIDKLDEKIKEEMLKIDINCLEQKEQLNVFVNELVLSIKDQHINLSAELDDFYNDKKAKMNQALIDTNQVKDFHKNLTNELLHTNVEKMMNKLYYSAMNLIEKNGYFKENDNFKIHKIGKIIKPIFEKPLKAYKLETKIEPSRIISTNNGFIALQNNCQIYQIKPGKCIFLKRSFIQDIAPAYNNQLSYMTVKNSRYYCKIVSLDNYVCMIKCNLQRKVVKSKLMFGVFNKNIILNVNTGKTYFYKKPSLKETSIIDKNLTRNEKSINYKSFQNGLCIEYDSYIEYIFDETMDSIAIDIDHSYSLRNNNNISLYQDIITNLLNGKKLISDDEKVIVFDENLLSAFSIPNDLIFPGKILKEYRFFNDEIIFCLREKDNSKAFSFQHYPLFESHF